MEAGRARLERPLAHRGTGRQVSDQAGGQVERRAVRRLSGRRVSELGRGERLGLGALLRHPTQGRVGPSGFHRHRLRRSLRLVRLQRCPARPLQVSEEGRGERQADAHREREEARLELQRGPDHQNQHRGSFVFFT